MTMIKNHGSLTFRFLLLSLLAVVLSACQDSKEETDKDEPTVSAISIDYIAASDSWRLRFDSAEPILCAVNLAEISNTNFDTLQAMDMTRPAKEHDIQLSVIAGQRYRLQITTFSTANEVQKSSEFSFTAARTENNNLIDEDEPTFTPVTNFNPTDIWTLAPQANNITANSARIDFTSSTPTLASTAYGKTPGYGLSQRIAGGDASLSHNVQLLALDDDSTYHYNVILIDTAGTLYKSQNDSFTTPKDNSANNSIEGENVALLSLGATISSVSSIYSNSFNANKAIDDDKNSEWSSKGDGNNAYIEISLDKTYLVTGVGFWTRTMGSSAEISQFEVLTTTGASLGVFDLSDANQLYSFDISDSNQQTLRFKVTQSNGGNTGAKTIAIYAKTN